MLQIAREVERDPGTVSPRSAPQRSNEERGAEVPSIIAQWKVQEAEKRRRSSSSSPTIRCHTPGADVIAPAAEPGSRKGAGQERLRCGDATNFGAMLGPHMVSGPSL